MNTAEQQLQQVEISMEKAKEAVALADALERLHDNKDFKLVFTENYFKNEAARAVLFKGDNVTQNEVQQADIDRVIAGIGALYAHFNDIFQQGNMAQQALHADANTREEILQEQLENETVM